MSEIGIVGGLGFIGSTLARHLVQSFSVRVLDIKRVPKSLEGKIEYQHCDVRKYSDVECMHRAGFPNLPTTPGVSSRTRIFLIHRDVPLVLHR